MPTTQRAPTIWQALAEKLGREPTHAELCADVRRILQDAADERLSNAKGSRK